MPPASLTANRQGATLVPGSVVCSQAASGDHSSAPVCKCVLVWHQSSSWSDRSEGFRTKQFLSQACAHEHGKHLTAHWSRCLFSDAGELLESFCENQDWLNALRGYFDAGCTLKTCQAQIRQLLDKQKDAQRIIKDANALSARCLSDMNSLKAEVTDFKASFAHLASLTQDAESLAAAENKQKEAQRSVKEATQLSVRCLADVNSLTTQLTTFKTCFAEIASLKAEMTEFKKAERTSLANVEDLRTAGVKFEQDLMAERGRSEQQRGKLASDLDQLSMQVRGEVTQLRRDLSNQEKTLQRVCVSDSAKGSTQTSNNGNSLACKSAGHVVGDSSGGQRTMTTEASEAGMKLLPKTSKALDSTSARPALSTSVAIDALVADAPRAPVSLDSAQAHKNNDSISSIQVQQSAQAPARGYERPLADPSLTTFVVIDALVGKVPDAQSAPVSMDSAQACKKKGSTSTFQIQQSSEPTCAQELGCESRQPADPNVTASEHQSPTSLPQTVPLQPPTTVWSDDSEQVRAKHSQMSQATPARNQEAAVDQDSGRNISDGLFRSEYPVDLAAREAVRQIEDEMLMALCDPIEDRKKLHRTYLLEWHPDKGCAKPHSAEVLKFVQNRKAWFLDRDP